MSYSFSRHYQHKKISKIFYLKKSTKRNLKYEKRNNSYWLKSIYKKFNYNFIIKDSLASLLRVIFIISQFIINEKI